MEETKEERIQRLVKEGIEREKQKDAIIKEGIKKGIEAKAKEEFRTPASTATVASKVVSVIVVIMLTILAGSAMFKISDPVGYNNFLLNTVYGYDRPNTNEYTPVAPALNPARDLTGDWSGTFRHTENSDSPDWTTTGKVTMTIQQTGNKVKGTYTFRDMITTSRIKEFNKQESGGYINPITGTVGGTRFEFTDSTKGYIRYSASFTSDMLKVNYESCSLNKLCVYGQEKLGEGIENVGAPGIKGVMTLTRD